MLLNVLNIFKSVFVVSVCYKTILTIIHSNSTSDYSGRFTIPIVWDKIKGTIVSNESSEIIRMFNTEFNEFCKTPEQKALDLYPDSLKEKIDDVNSWIYP